MERLVIDTAPEPRASVIWLHGLGADGHDFAPVVPHLKMRGATRFVFPHAPSQPVTINGGMSMPAWYDILELSFQRKVDEDGMIRSRNAIQALIEEERTRGIPADRIVLAGFSQGGAMTLDTGIRHHERLAGLLVLSAYLPLQNALEARNSGWDTPILQCHGRFDPVVPIAMGEMSRDALIGCGIDVTWKDYPCDHTVTMPEIADIGVWLNSRLFPE